MLAQSMRPAWKADTYSLPMPDGVYLRGNNNRLFLKGKSLYPLLEHLVPYLTGDVTLAEITEGLDADRKRMVTNLVEKLFAHQFLNDRSQDQPHTPGSLDLETHASDIAFIESFQTSAASRFERFRNERLLIIGSWPSCTALALASLQSGLRKIGVIATSENEMNAPFHQDMLDLFTHYASDGDAHIIDRLSWDNEAEVRQTIQAYDAILHIAEQSALARAQLLNKLCVEQQKTGIQAVLVDDQAWIGPLVSPETGGCWECAWRRLQANQADLKNRLSHSAYSNQPSVSNSRPLTKPGATIIANRLLFELFQHCAQINAKERAGKVSELNLETCLSESHTFLPHPHCLACQHPVTQTASQFLEQVQRLQQQSPIDANIFLESFTGCVDEKLGLFTAVENGHLVQIPLAVYQAHLSNPMLWDHQPAPLHIVAVSTDTREARMRAAQKACERYAANFMDQRRLLPFEITQQYSLPIVPIEQVVGQKTLFSEDEMWSWALDLQMQQASFVPAARVFSSPGEQEQGIGSGATWEEAICQALLDWCNYLTIEQLKNAQQAYPQVDLERTVMTPEGAYLYQLLKTAHEQITVYDITGSLHIPTFAVCSGKNVVAYTTHCDGARALSLGLEQALQHYQSKQFQQPDYATVPVPDFPVKLRSDELSVPHYTLPDTWSERQACLLQQLQANRLHAFAVPLDHDPALTRVFPFIVRVLLSRQELKKEA